MKTETTPPDTCPLCGAEKAAEIVAEPLLHSVEYDCGSQADNWTDEVVRTSLCHEREASKKAEAEFNIYKRKIIECLEACEPLREIKGLKIGDSITSDGIKLMIKENAKLRELLHRALYHRGHSMGCYTENYDNCECGSDSVQEDYDELNK